MRTTQRRFTPDEDGFIRANYRSMPARDIAQHLDRPINGVRKRAAKLGLSVPLKRWGDAEDEIIRAAWGSRQLLDVARELDRGVSEISARAKHLGCAPWRTRKGTHSGRPVDGFAGGKPIYTHRTVVEGRLGRKLRSDEIVHHIDGNKHNNDSANLYVFPSRAAHRKAHSTLESIMPTLLERGIIKFDFDKGIYQLCEIRRASMCCMPTTCERLPSPLWRRIFGATEQ